MSFFASSTTRPKVACDSVSAADSSVQYPIIPPCTLEAVAPDDEQQAAGVVEVWKVTHKKTADQLVVSIHEVLHDSAHELGTDPGLQKDGVEAHLQQLLAEQIEILGRVTASCDAST